jgi:hypothetical protein
MGQSRREYWTNLIAEHQACGKTVRGFCRRIASAPRGRVQIDAAEQCGKVLARDLEAVCAGFPGGNRVTSFLQAFRPDCEAVLIPIQNFYPVPGTGEIPHTDRDLWLSSTAGIRFMENDCRYIGAHRSAAATLLFTLKRARGHRMNCPRG